MASQSNKSPTSHAPVLEGGPSSDDKVMEGSSQQYEHGASVTSGSKEYEDSVDASMEDAKQKHERKQVSGVIEQGSEPDRQDGNMQSAGEPGLGGRLSSQKPSSEGEFAISSNSLTEGCDTSPQTHKAPFEQRTEGSTKTTRDEPVPPVSDLHLPPLARSIKSPEPSNNRTSKVESGGSSTQRPSTAQTHAKAHGTATGTPPKTQTSSDSYISHFDMLDDPIMRLRYRAAEAAFTASQKPGDLPLSAYKESRFHPGFKPPAGVWSPLWDMPRAQAERIVRKRWEEEKMWPNEEVRNRM